MSIKNREDANKYYKLVNNLIDDYIDKWKIRPKNLKNYLREGSDKFENFIIRNGLAKIDGIKQVVKDVIDDRVYMEEDGILTFESFKVFESDDFKISSILDCFTKGIDKIDINTEKFLADEFDTNLSHIDIVDSDKHIFTISNWGNDKIDILIFKEEDFKTIMHNLDKYFVDKFVDKVLDVHGVKIDFKDIIDNDKFTNELKTKIDFDKKVEILTNALKKEGKDLEFKKSEGYFYWIIK